MDANSVPSLKQIQNYVSRLKPRSEPLTDALLKEYAEEHLAVPEDENEPFVTDYMPFDDKHFVIVWTTRKLAQIQSKSIILATDATYKLSW